MRKEGYITGAIFIFCMLSRILFKLLSGYDNFELFGDALRYDFLSERILNGNHDLDIVAFVNAPLYPYTMAFFKYVFSSHWQFALLAYHFVLISISAVGIYKISRLLFGSIQLAVISSVLYILYPLCLWYNATFTQEASFQSFMILFIYFFLKFIKQEKLRELMIASLFFFLALATKSHIILLLPMIVLFLIYTYDLRSGLIFFFIIYLLNQPQSIHNRILYGSYSLTGYSSGSMLLAGHSDETYPCLTKEIHQHPEIKTGGCDLDVIFHPPYEFKDHGQVNLMPYGKRNQLRISMAWEWIKENPAKFRELKMNGLRRFLLPGLDHRIYSPLKWIVSLILGLLFYIPAYIYIIKNARRNFKELFLVLSIILLIAMMFLVFYPQNRFRVITLEPLLIVYASKFYWDLRFRKADPEINH